MIRQSELAQRLADKHNIGKRNVSDFLNSFIDVIRENLASDGSVKIKGLGTFKVVKVKDRESVNVNTGERYIIYGHERLSFTPDSLMKELVNRPFSQFDTVELNDGVVFEDIEEDKTEDIDETPIDDFADESDENVSPIDEDIETESEEIQAENDNETVVYNLVGTEDKGRQVEETADEEVVIGNDTDNESEKEVQPATEETENTVVDSRTDEKSDDNSDSVDEAVDTLAVPLADSHNVDVSAEESADDDPMSAADDNPTGNFWNMRKALMLSMLTLVVGLCAGYGLGRYLFPKSPAVIYVAEDSTLQDSLKEETKEKAAAVVPEKDTAKVVSQVKEKPDTVAAEKSKQSEYEAKYAEIRYGAYNIEGVDQTVTVRKGQTLASISRSYLGPDMMCYMVAINDGISEVKEGQTVKIPKLRLKQHLRKKK
ncbi:MAG: HU family DNA-binding protein [Prevotella sp.]|nr:HU family DNA-binding protein [Prevotella sp.]